MREIKETNFNLANEIITEEAGRLPPLHSLEDKSKRLM